MDVRIYEALSDMASKNESIILVQDILKVMQVISSVYNLDYQEASDYFLTQQIRAHSECKDPHEIECMVKSYTNESVVVPNVDTQLSWLENIPQPIQRSEEWYIYRNGRVTASSAYKILSSQSKYMELLAEKVLRKQHGISNSAPLLHGIRNECNVQCIYEIMKNVKISEYGCIPHPYIEHIGESPDGIVTCAKDTYLLGRMLEIKCLYSRKMTGIVKYCYWVQVQLQLEVCGLEYCDFFECKINENLTEEEFYTMFDTPMTEKCYCGIMIEYLEPNESNEYTTKWLYSPVKGTAEAYKHWYNESTKQFCGNTNKDYVKCYFWKLENFSLRTIKRNRDWFRKCSK